MLCLVFFVIVLLLIVIMLIRINVVVEYKKKGSEDNFVIAVYALKGIIKYKYESPLIDFQGKGIKFKWIKEKGKKEKDVKKGRKFFDFIEFFNSFGAFKDFFEKHIRKKLILEKLNLALRIGTGDAFYTGIISGVVWTFIGFLTVFVYNNFYVLEKKIVVEPVFTKKVLKIDLLCIFNIKLVNIIPILARILIQYLKGRTGQKNLGGGVSG